MNTISVMKYTALTVFLISAAGCIAIPKSSVFDEACKKTPPVRYMNDPNVDFSKEILTVSGKIESSKNLVIATSKALNANTFAVNKETIRDIFGERVDYAWSILEIAPGCTGNIYKYLLSSNNRHCVRHEKINNHKINYAVSTRSFEHDAGLGRSVLVNEKLISNYEYEHIFHSTIFMATGKTRLASGTSITFNCEKDNDIKKPVKAISSLGKYRHDY